MKQDIKINMVDFAKRFMKADLEHWQEEMMLAIENAVLFPIKEPKFFDGIYTTSSKGGQTIMVTHKLPKQTKQQQIEALQATIQAQMANIAKLNQDISDAVRTCGNQKGAIEQLKIECFHLHSQLERQAGVIQTLKQVEAEKDLDKPFTTTKRQIFGGPNQGTTSSSLQDYLSPQYNKYDRDTSAQKPWYLLGDK